MPRKHPQPFWRSQTKCWYVQIRGKQHRLHHDREEAFRLYHGLMGRKPETPPPGPSSGVPVLDVLDAFLEWTKNNQARKTYTWYRDNVQHFVDAIPKAM